MVEREGFYPDPLLYPSITTSYIMGMFWHDDEYNESARWMKFESSQEVS